MDEPTQVSLQHTIDLIQRKYGSNWRDYPHCIGTVIWASRLFLPDHVKEIVPDLFDLCQEYQDKGTVNGKKFDWNFSMLAFAVVDPSYPIIEA